MLKAHSLPQHPHRALLRRLIPEASREAGLAIRPALSVRIVDRIDHSCRHALDRGMRVLREVVDRHRVNVKAVVTGLTDAPRVFGLLDVVARAGVRLMFRYA